MAVGSNTLEPIRPKRGRRNVGFEARRDITFTGEVPRIKLPKRVDSLQGGPAFWERELLESLTADVRNILIIGRKNRY